MISQWVKTLGVELEGGMLSSSYSKISRIFKKWNLDNNVSSSYDGSIRRTSDWGTTLVSNELKFWAENLIDIKHFLDWAYKVGNVKTNSSCGFHLHVMFVDHPYTLFSFARKEVVKQFHDAYIEKFHDNPKYLSRLENHYSKRNNFSNRFLIESMTKGYGDRYVSVNFCSVAKHSTQVEISGRFVRYPGTLEFRVFPYQETSKEAYETVKWLIKTIDDILNRHKDDSFWVQVY